MQELNELIYKYNNSYTIYNKENTVQFLNNMYLILGNYLHLLSANEYQYTKEAIKKTLSYQFDFIDKYIHTYKIILIKIWITKYKNNFYFIRNNDLNNKKIYLMTENNKDLYEDTGYICDIPKDFISYLFHDSTKKIKY